MQTQNSTYYYQTRKNLTELLIVTLSLFKLKSNKTVNQWAAEKRFITKEESARPGQWDNSIQPHANKVMEAFTNPEVEKISGMMSAQLFKTEVMKNMIGYIIDEQPDPILIIYPTDGDARDFSSEKLDPMLNSNKCFEGKLAPAKANSKDNKTLFKKFTGGFLAIAGGRVPQDLARRSVKYVVADDRDRIGEAGDEGDAIALAWQRTESYAFFGRKLIEFSTPTIKGLSQIEASYLQSNQMQYYVPCPFCGELQTLKFENLIWEKEESDIFGHEKRHLLETVKLKCINDNCGELIEEKHKTWMIENGDWIAKYPDRKSHLGFWINRLYSSFSSWVDIVKLFLESKDDPSKLQVFYNTVLALTWQLEESEEIDETKMLERVEDYNTDENPRIPNSVLYLTAFVDHQIDRIEVQIEGWGIGEENWLIHYEKVWGSFDQQEVQNRLDELLNQTWTREDGISLGLGGRLNGKRYYACLIDSGGTYSMTQMVYDYTRGRQHLGIIASKGRSGPLPVLVNKSMVSKTRDVILYNIGIDTVKQLLWKRLPRNTRNKNNNIIHAPGVCHFTKEFSDNDYFKALLAERPFKGYDKRYGNIIIWRKYKKGIPNEPWDLKIGNYAAFKSAFVDLEKLAEKQKQNKEDKDIPETKKHTNKKIRIVKKNFVRRTF